MNQMMRPVRADETERNAPDAETPSVESVVLMSGRRELIIRHGADNYRLRVTASNKLILTK